MKVNRGVTDTLVGMDAMRAGIRPRATDAVRVHGAGRPVRSGAATVQKPVSRHRGRKPNRTRTLTLLTVAASAALLGCSSLTSGPWRVEPAYRVEAGHPKPAQGYLALARQYEGEKRIAQALDAYRNAAKAAPTDADVQNTVGLAFARHGQFAPAVAALRRAVALAPERAQLLNNLGYALLLDGRTEDARAMLRLTLAVNPTHEAALRNLAYIDQQLPAVAAKAVAPVTAVAEVAAAVPTVVPAAVAQAAVVPATAEAPAVAATMPEQASASESAATQAAIAPAPQAVPGDAEDPASRARLAARAQLGGVSVEIVNGNGTPGTAARLRVWLRERGVEAGRLANLWPYKSAHTLVLYRPGRADEAREVAARMPLHAEVAPAPAGSTRADLRVLIGHDARYAAGCAVLGNCATPERLASSGDLAGRDTAGDGTARR
jgi:tetratricopeptide (TPR) repeat protein